MSLSKLTLTLIGAGFIAAACCATTASAAGQVVGFITKTEGNPFFVAMRKGAESKAAELGLDL